MERIVPIAPGDCALLYDRCFAVARKLPLVAILLMFTAGCTRSLFRSLADRDVENLLAEKTKDPRWALDGWFAYPDKRARFADFDKPDRPKKPPDDPAAAALAPNPQPWRSILHSGPDQEGHGYLEFLQHCDQHNRTLLARAAADDNKPMATLGAPASPTGYVDPGLPGPEPMSSIDGALRTGEQGFLITLEQALELSLFNSRDFQDRREDLYVTALPVTLQRFSFYTQLFAGTTAIREWRGRETVGGPGSQWNIASTGSVSQLFPTGAQLVARFANQVVVELGTGNPTIGISNLSLDVMQPLLQGGGWAVTMEPLTQAERTLVYGVRSYARFRKNFYVFIAGGGDQNNSPYSFSFLTTRGVGISFERTFARIPAHSAGDRFGTQRRENLRALNGYLATLPRVPGARRLLRTSGRPGRTGHPAVAIELARASAALQNGLDQFKLQLGVPTRTPLQLDDAPTKAMRDMLADFAKAQGEFQSLRAEADQYRSRLRNPLQALAGSAISVIPLDLPLRKKPKHSSSTRR